MAGHLSRHIEYLSYPIQGASNLNNIQDTSINGIDITSAAEKLGISVEAARKRVQRGSLQGYKVDGRWYIILDKQDTLDRTIKDSVQDNVQDCPDTEYQSVQTYKELVKSLQNEISFLRQELSARTEENRRKDHIIAGLAQRIPELPMPNEPLNSNEQLKQDLVDIIQAEVAATQQQINEQERKAEERDRQLMETLRALQQKAGQEKKKKSWWLFGIK
jgi:hypothetical protein